MGGWKELVFFFCSFYGIFCTTSSAFKNNIESFSSWKEVLTAALKYTEFYNVDNIDEKYIKKLELASTISSPEQFPKIINYALLSVENKLFTDMPLRTLDRHVVDGFLRYILYLHAGWTGKKLFNYMKFVTNMPADFLVEPYFNAWYILTKNSSAGSQDIFHSERGVWRLFLLTNAQVIKVMYAEEIILHHLWSLLFNAVSKREYPKLCSVFNKIMVIKSQKALWEIIRRIPITGDWKSRIDKILSIDSIFIVKRFQHAMWLIDTKRF